MRIIKFNRGSILKQIIINDYIVNNIYTYLY